MSDMVEKLQTLWDELLKQAEIVRAQDENIIINKDRSLSLIHISEPTRPST